MWTDKNISWSNSSQEVKENPYWQINGFKSDNLFISWWMSTADSKIIWSSGVPLLKKPSKSCFSNSINPSHLLRCFPTSMGSIPNWYPSQIKTSSGKICLKSFTPCRINNPKHWLVSSTIAPILLQEYTLWYKLYFRLRLPKTRRRKNQKKSKHLSSPIYSITSATLTLAQSSALPLSINSP